jgi:hypothetical protein
MDDNNELTIYILQQLRQGVPEQSVRAILAQNGWPQPLVDRAFSMVMQARPHALTPPAGTPPDLTTPVQQTSNLPPPTENPYPILEGEKKRERRSIMRKLLAVLGVLLVIALIGGAIWFFTQSRENNKDNTKQQPISQDEKRKENLDKLADALMSYYSKSGNSYPTLSSINDPNFATSKNGFKTAGYNDPAWNKDKSTCTNDKKEATFVEAHTAGCITYRATAANGEDCDAKDKACTRLVLTSLLDTKQPYIVVLDQNVKE